jgi:hypothetical protein
MIFVLISSTYWGDPNTGRSNTGTFGFKYGSLPPGLARRGFSATPAYIPETRRDTRLMKLVLKPLHVLATANAIDYQEDISSRT